MSRYTLDQLMEHQDKRDEVRFGFYKQVLLMASGLFGILISLHKTVATDSSNDNTRIAFALSIALIALGILLLSIALYAQVAVHTAVHLQLRDELLKQLKDEAYNPKFVNSNPSKIYHICEKISYISFALSIIGLTIYTVIIT